MAVAISFAIACSRAPRDTEPRAASDPAAHARAAVRLILIADLERVLEPCGCTSPPRGGVDRLATAISELRRGARNAVVLAAGNMFAAPDVAAGGLRVQDEWQADALSAVLARCAPAAFAVGDADRAREPARVAALARDAKLILLGSRGGDSTSDALTPSAQLHTPDVEIGLVAAPAGETAREVAALRARGAELVIAFVQGEARLARSTAENAGADLIVHSGAGGTAAVSPTKGALLVSAGHHAEHVLALDVWPGSGGPWQVSSVAPGADARAVVVHDLEVTRDVASDGSVRALLDRVFRRINAHNADAYRAVRPPPATADAPGYVGSRTCAACHTPAYFWWQRTPHARAFDTLVARGRELDLDCVGCHVTGYEKPGGSTIGHLDELKGVGCESCHGPGSSHVNNPQQPGRAIARVAPEATCAGCHDREHSDAFAYAQARARLLVPQHGAAAPTARASRTR
jgi:hypothetical protein